MEFGRLIYYLNRKSACGDNSKQGSRLEDLMENGKMVGGVQSQRRSPLEMTSVGIDGRVFELCFNLQMVARGSSCSSSSSNQSNRQSKSANGNSRRQGICTSSRRVKTPSKRIWAKALLLRICTQRSLGLSLSLPLTHKRQRGFHDNNNRLLSPHGGYRIRVTYYY